VDMSRFDIEIYLAVLVRIGGLFIFAPFFNNRVVPIFAKIGLSAFLAFFVVTTTPVQEMTMAPSDSAFLYLILIIREAMIGFVFGFLLSCLFAGVQAARASHRVSNGV